GPKMWQCASQAFGGGLYFGVRVFGSGAMQTGMLGIERPFEPVEHLHRGHHLRDARARLALLADRRYELTGLQPAAAHRDLDLRQIDLVLLAVEEIVVARDVRAVVADIAEEGALRPVVVERER